MEEKYLPLGTVVLLKNASKELMIIGYGGINMKKREVFDYSGCIYPEGSLGSAFGFLFNHDQIEKVISKGYHDEKWDNFIKELDEKTANKTKDELIENYVNTINSLGNDNNNQSNNDAFGDF